MDVILQNWKFHLGDIPAAWNRDFDDTGWPSVVVPHDWSVSLPFSKEYSSGTGYLAGGTGWYRTGFKLPDAPKSVWISFDGVYKNSQVWCNGYYIGRRPSGYTSFMYDISDFVRFGGDENLISVKVTHEDIADSRWFTGSGIYRKVRVLTREPIYIPDESVVFTTDENENGDALISVSASVKGAKFPLHVDAIMTDTDGKSVTFGADITSHDFTLQTVLKSPQLWTPDSPNLYSLKLVLVCEGMSGETAPISVGIRTIRLDAEKGFFINGKPMKLKGVCVHHDAGCLGAAVWPDVWRRRLIKLKEMGCNAIRTSHNPHMPELYELCDELGFFVMDEAFDEWEGVKNKWAYGHNVYPPKHQGYYEDFPEWHERDLAGMVIRDRNHPSVIMWSVGNEIDYPNDPYCHPLFAEMEGNNDSNKPKSERLYNDNKPNAQRLSTIAAQLSAIVRRYDTTRPVLTAAAFPELSSQIGFFDSFDVIGYNYKEQLYNEHHALFPSLPIFGSENGHDYKNWLSVRDNDFICAQFLWTGIDFLGEARGWPIRGSYAGLLDVAGFEKVGYYRRKAMWSEETVAFLTAGYPGDTLLRSWSFLKGKMVNVFCYTNAVQAELHLNGKSLGIRNREDNKEYIQWEVEFERGELTVTAGEVSDTLASYLPASEICLSPWKCGQTTAVGEYRLTQLEVAMKDEAGRICADSSAMLNVCVSGDGKLLGIENGDLSDCSEYAASYRRVHHGRAIVYILTKSDAAEPCVVTVTSKGLPSAAITLATDSEF